MLFNDPFNPILRFPNQGYVCNLASGGFGIPANVDQEDLKILNKIKRFLKSQRIIWAGVDLIESSSGRKYLGEINLTCPGAGVATDQIYGDNNLINSIVLRTLEHQNDN